MHSPKSKRANVSQPALGLDGREYPFAFQPIVNVKTQQIFAFEALIRTLDNQPASQVFARIPETDLHTFDRQSRLNAIRLAGHLGLNCRLNLNVLPLSLRGSNDAIESALETAYQCNIRPEQIVLEILEKEVIADPKRLSDQLQRYRTTGLTFAIDDFGSGYAGLKLLAEFQPDYIKLDIDLVVPSTKRTQASDCPGILLTCRDLGIDVLAEGVEQIPDYFWLHDRASLCSKASCLPSPSSNLTDN